MPPNVTSVLKESTVQVENQNPEVTVLQGITVQVALVWQSSFHVLMAHTILIMLKPELMNVLTALRAISVKRQQFNLCSVP